MMAAVITIILTLLGTAILLWGSAQLDRLINGDVYRELAQVQRRELEREIADIEEALEQYPHPSRGAIADLRSVLRARSRSLGVTAKEADYMLENLLKRRRN